MADIKQFNSWQYLATGWAHDDNNIKGFFGKYRYLSNFHFCDINFEFSKYPSSENAYQAAKTLNAEDRAAFLTYSPNEAKKQGRRLKLREDWEEVKVQIMRLILMDKFYGNEELRKKLISTKDRYLEETNWWNDTFWGVCRGKGENQLGKLLMEIRNDISKRT